MSTAILDDWPSVPVSIFELTFLQSKRNSAARDN
jgi:hypothetical protein